MTASSGNPAWWRRLKWLDWLTAGLLAAGAVAVAAGLLPWGEVESTDKRILPLLLFLAAVTVLAELAARADVFDVIATRIAILARGRNTLLFGLCLLLAAVTTIVLNLDTTAILLTPVMLAAARRVGVPLVPLAMTTVWLANTASLLLPVSNLTNLLAMNRVQLSPLEFAARMALPQLAALVVVAACLWTFYWRHNPTRFRPPEPFRPRDRRVFLAAATASAVFVGGILAGLSLYWMSAGCAIALVLAFAIWERSELSWNLIPWRLLIFVTSLLLVVDTFGRHGLSHWMHTLIGADPGPSGTIRAAATGGVLSNVLNNLPTYLAGEAVIPRPHHDQLLGLLIGSNIGPLVTPWGSLATLLWAERCAATGVRIDWRRFTITGACTAALVLIACVAALLITPP
jgi:arsenical pump membrane protein